MTEQTKFANYECGPQHATHDAHDEHTRDTRLPRSSRAASITVKHASFRTASVPA